MLPESFKDVSTKIKGVLSSFKGVSRVFEISLKCVSGKFQWCFRKFQSSFKEVFVFEESFKGIST